MAVRPRRGGWKRPDLRSLYTDAQLRALHVVHMRGASINSLAKQTYRKAGYASHGSAATAISKAWKKLGLPARDRIEQTVLSSTKHGRKRRRQTNAEQTAYRRWLRDQRGWRAIQGPGRPRCIATKRQHPHKGSPCQRPAMEGSDYCVSHDPRRELARQAHLSTMRRRLPSKPMVPMGPFVRWLERRADELGSWPAVAASVGLSLSSTRNYALRQDGNKRPKLEVGVDVVERCLEQDGTASFEDLYGAELAEAA